MRWFPVSATKMAPEALAHTPPGLKKAAVGMAAPSAQALKPLPAMVVLGAVAISEGLKRLMRWLPVSATTKVE
jgi:hypothetical protein